MAEVARSIQRNVKQSVERMTGLKVVEVNVSVNDIHLPTDDDGDATQPVARLLTVVEPPAPKPAALERAALEPAALEPAALEPAVVEPAVVEPAVVEPAVVEPAVVEPALVDGVDVVAVERAVRACVGVSDLYTGRFAEIGSYLPGRRVVGGVQVDDDTLTVQVRARWGHTPRDLFDQVAGVTAPLRHGRTLNLVIADIDDDPGAGSPPVPSGTRASTSAVPRPPALDAAPAHLSLPESSSS